MRFPSSPVRGHIWSRGSRGLAPCLASAPAPALSPLLDWGAMAVLGASTTHPGPHAHGQCWGEAGPRSQEPEGSPSLVPTEPGALPLPACLASACSGCTRTSHAAPASCSRWVGETRVLRVGEGGAGPGEGAPQLCLFLLLPGLGGRSPDPSGSFCPPRHLSSCPPEPRGGWEACCANACPGPSGVLLMSPDPALSQTGGVQGTSTSLCPRPHAPALCFFGGSWPRHGTLALLCWLPRLPSRVFLLRWQ